MRTPEHFKKGLEYANKAITFRNVLRAFEEMKELSEVAKGDAEVGLDQLRHAYSKFSTTKL